MVLLIVDGYFDDMVLLVFEDAVCFFDLRERETVGDERSGVYLALFDELEYLVAVTSVYATGLEGEVFAVHLW